MGSLEDQVTPLKHHKERSHSRLSQTDPHKLRSTIQDIHDVAPNTVGRGDLAGAYGGMFSARRLETGELNLNLITEVAPTTPQSTYVPNRHTSNESGERPPTGGKLKVDQVIPPFQDFARDYVDGEFREQRVPSGPSTPHVKIGFKKDSSLHSDASTGENRPDPAPENPVDNVESPGTYPSPSITSDNPPVDVIGINTPTIDRVPEQINSSVPRSNSSSILPHIWLFLGAVLWAAALGWFISVSIGENETRYLYHVFQVFFGGFFATGMFRVIIEKDNQSSDMMHLAWGFLNPKTTILFSLLNQPILLHEIIFHLLKDKLFLYVHGEAVATNKQIETETVIDITSVVHVALLPLLVYVLCVSNAASFYLLKEKSLIEAIQEGHALFKRNYIKLAVLVAINQIRTILPYTAARFLGSLGLKLPNGNEQMNEVVALMTLVIIAMPISIPSIYQDFKRISARG